MYQHQFKSSIFTPSGEIITDRIYSAAGHVGVVESIANGQTNFVVNLAIDVSAVKSIVIVSDQNITVKTNDNSTPDNTLTLVAGKEYSWNTDSLQSLLLTADVTSLHVANASGETATLTLDCILDPSP